MNLASNNNDNCSEFNYVILDEEDNVCGISTLTFDIDVPSMIRVTDSSNLIGKKYDHLTKTFIGNGERKPKKSLVNFSEDQIKNNNKLIEREGLGKRTVYGNREMLEDKIKDILNAFRDLILALLRFISWFLSDIIFISVFILLIYITVKVLFIK